MCIRDSAASSPSSPCSLRCAWLRVAPGVALPAARAVVPIGCGRWTGDASGGGSGPKDVEIPGRDTVRSRVRRGDSGVASVSLILQEDVPAKHLFEEGDN